MDGLALFLGRAALRPNEPEPNSGGRETSPCLDPGS